MANDSQNWQQRAKAADLQVRNFIEGEYRDCAGDTVVSKYSARDGQLLYQFGEGNGSEVEAAVSSARAAFDDGRWRGLPVSARKAVLQKLADLVEAHKEEFALYECLDVGKPISNALNDDLGRAIHSLRSAAEGIDNLLSPSGSDGFNLSYRLRKPVGVVVGICAWNYPLAIAASKLGPALITGNSLILKPSEFSPLSTGLLAELAVEAGIPPGVCNVVNGSGAVVGDRLAHHNEVDLISFTGGTATGKRLMSAAGQSNMKRLVLECGGKSPYLVFDDHPGDLDFIAADVVSTAFPNQGALCVAGTRLLVQNSIKEQLLPKIIEHAKKITPADPLDPETTFGALINEAHMEKVMGYVESGKQEGATLLYGGNRVNTESGGYYIEPAIFDSVSPSQRIANEEIFGPVLSVFGFEDEDEAIKIANSTCFGLAAYVGTKNLTRIQKVSHGLNTGIIVVASTDKPSGGLISIGIEGHRQSGFGFEGGADGLAAYTVSSAVHLLA